MKANEFLRESNEVQNLVDEFMQHYKDDPRGMYTLAKEMLLTGMHSGKNFSLYAAELLHTFKNSSPEEQEEIVIKHTFPFLKKHEYPGFSSVGWGAAEQEMTKKYFRNTKEFLESVIEKKLPAQSKKKFSIVKSSAENHAGKLVPIWNVTETGSDHVVETFDSFGDAKFYRDKWNATAEKQ